MPNDTLTQQSISEVLWASTILWLRIIDLQSGPWQASADGLWQVASTTINLRLEKALKGEVQQQPGDVMTLVLTLRDSLRPQGDPGPWSRLPLSRDQQLVAFCEGETVDAQRLLAEENCRQLLPAELVLDDVQRAMALERGRRPVALILEEAQKNSSRLGDVFARYVWAKALPRNEEAQFQAIGLSSLAGEQPPSFERKAEAAGQIFGTLMGLLAGAETDERARAAYLACAMNTINLMSPPPWNWEMQLIQTLFRLLELPQAAVLHRAVGQVYLPNLLGLRAPVPRYRPEEVFPKSAEAQRQLSALDQNQLDPALARWLEGKE